ncbi:hypothetical protein CKW00_03360 [Salimicrobium humidisoli]|uniref:Uncharacterized protein n=1 Tax=Salimicrobium humidisoli TaxID=2029857 RepID=A0ABX4HT23_9BACI|nr:hypothetical protein CKW00_03360 [Salimicrobium humidisoli]
MFTLVHPLKHLRFIMRIEKRPADDSAGPLSVLVKAFFHATSNILLRMIFFKAGGFGKVNIL